MRLTLAPHPDTPCDAVREIAVEVAREGRGLSLIYAVEGEINRIALADPGPRVRADDLWKHTCFEAFLRPQASSPLGSLLPLREKVSAKPTDEGSHRPQSSLSNPPHGSSTSHQPLIRRSATPSPARGEGRPEAAAYTEINLSPSGAWAAYSFDGYREGMATPAEFAPPPFSDRRASDRYELQAELNLDFPDTEWRLALSAVIELTDGSKSYWAIAHAPGKPDFHHPDAFAVILPPESP